MQQTTASAPSTASPSFAGLMAALAAPTHKPPEAWDDSDLADDVATLSYESALRTHTRYRPAPAPDQSLAQASPFLSKERIAAVSSSMEQAEAQADAIMEELPSIEQRPASCRSAHFERNLKDASITIRLSKAECTQLHRRAAEAGLTVSAYLRSCTFEAESLRAMVKDTMAQLRSATNPAKSEAHHSWLSKLTGWMARLATPWNGSHRVARA